MTAKRNIEIFSANCPLCEKAVEQVKKMSCSSCEVTVLDMNDKTVSERANKLGIHRVPAVVIDGKLLDCCTSGAINEEKLREAGVGQPLT